MTWEEKSFDEIGFISRGRSRHRPRNAEHLYGGEYPFIQTGDVKAANFRVLEHSQTYNEAGLEQSKLWPKDTLCITIAANIAETALLGYDACFPDSIIGFIPYEDKADVRFVKYFFDVWKEKMQRVAAGAAQDNLSLEKLIQFKIPTPPISTQRKIASILSAYDDLIENNLKRIKLLEEKAYVEYQELISSSKCEKHLLKDIVIVDWGDTNVTKASYVKSGFKAFSASGNDGYTDYFDFDCPGIVVSAIGAYCGKIWFTLGKWTAIKNTMTLISKSEVPLEFVFYSLNNPDKWHKRGSAQPFLSKADTMEMEILIPIAGLKDFGFSARRIFELKENLENQNIKLREARDILLPRLMNGQIEV